MKSKVLVAMSRASSISITRKLLLSFILLIVHLYLSWIHKDFVWLSAYGGLITVLGVIMLFNFTFPHDLEKDFPPKLNIEKTKNGYIEHNDNSPFGWELPNSYAEKMIEKYNEELEAYKLRFLNKKDRILSSFIFTIIGTLIWAYAGFLNILFGW
ncbi:hypothetical protein D5Q56_23640 [Vibrio parahaemolyticus]|nr:hypothetical protein [Vibrio parahaemolyticus]